MILLYMQTLFPEPSCGNAFFVNVHFNKYIFMAEHLTKLLNRYDKRVYTTHPSIYTKYLYLQMVP